MCEKTIIGHGRRATGISSREFREDLEWAVIVPGDGKTTVAVVKLLDELSARGVTIHDSCRDYW